MSWGVARHSKISSRPTVWPPISPRPPAGCGWGFCSRRSTTKSRDRNLERLLSHLESCPSCRRTWQDLTLMHQIGEAMEPSQYLLTRCINSRERKPKVTPILNRRLATAAAYLLAVMTSLIVGNPVTLARSQAVPAVERVAEVVTTEVAEAAQQGRGEVRVMMWRVWKWGENKVETVRSYLTGNEQDSNDDENAADDGANQGATT